MRRRRSRWTPEHPAYRGSWASEQEYIAEQVAEHLPPHLAWVLACCDPDRLRVGYEAGKLRVWSLPDPGREGYVWIFEVLRVAMHRDPRRPSS